MDIIKNTFENKQIIRVQIKKVKGNIRLNNYVRQYGKIIEIPIDGNMDVVTVLLESRKTIRFPIEHIIVINVSDSINFFSKEKIRGRTELLNNELKILSEKLQTGICTTCKNAITTYTMCAGCGYRCLNCDCQCKFLGDENYLI